MVYSVVRWFARRAIRWFYGDTATLNANAIPKSGATLIVASHGADLPDILLTFLATKRRIRFVANVSAADSWFAQFILARLSVIPISRVRDARALKARGEDAAALNVRAFQKVNAALLHGECVAIFPEGVVNDFPHLAPMRTGAARMALDAIVSRELTNLTMVAVGYQFEQSQQRRSGCLTVVGEPFRVHGWKPLHATTPISEFTRVIKNQLQLVTRNSATQTDANRLSEIVAAVAAATNGTTNTTHTTTNGATTKAATNTTTGTATTASICTTTDRSTNATADQATNTSVNSSASKAIAIAKSSILADAHRIQLLVTKIRSPHGLFVATPRADLMLAEGAKQPAMTQQSSVPAEVRDAQALLLDVERVALQMTDIVSSFGARPWSASDHALALQSAGDTSIAIGKPNLLRIIALAPLALLGWLWHVLPFWACRAQGKRFAPRPIEVAARTIVPGLYLIALWYVTIPVGLLFLGFSLWLVAPLFVAQPRLGDFALSWRDDIRSWKLTSRVQRAPISERQALLACADELRRGWRAFEEIVVGAYRFSHLVAVA